MKSQTAINNQTGQQLLTDTSTDPLPQIAIFAIQDFLKWWYVKMLIWHLRRIRRLSTVVDDQLSISLLVGNFFVPWHRDRSAIGYTFGILMKIIYLPIAIAIYIIAMTIYMGILIGWLLLPIGALVFVITSILR